MEVEVAIRLLYMLGEALPASHGAHFSGDATKTSVLQDMMRTVRPPAPEDSCPGSSDWTLSSVPPAGVLQREQLPALLRVPGVL